jgi:hypothetical protein
MIATETAVVKITDAIFTDVDSFLNPVDSLFMIVFFMCEM